MILRGNLNDWEICRMIELLKLPESSQGIQTGEDCLWWHGHNKGRYRMKEGYKQTSLRENQDFKWPWKQIWRIKVPQKVACFTWLPANEAVLTLDNVAKRGNLYVTDAPYSKIPLHCNVADFRNLGGISWSMPTQIDDTFFS